MTDQKLVDELEKALTDEAYDGGIGALDADQFRELVRTLAVTAAEVVEKAHTPTDDEREARQALDILHRYSFGSNEIGRAQVTGLLEVVSDALRRTAVPEPSAEIEFPFTHDGVTLEQDDGGLWIRINDVEPPRWLGPKAISALRAAWAEPQGEPSDAQVEAALDAWDSAGGPDAGRSGFRVMRAALRAAQVGGVR